MPSLNKNPRLPVVHPFSTCLLVVAALVCSTNAQSRSTDPGHKEQASIGSISFSCPNGFTPEHTDSNYQVAYMSHDREDLALFVAIPRAGAGDEYVEHLGTFLASYLFPQEWTVFAWKRLALSRKASKYETEGGLVNGFNGAQAVMLDYRRLQVKGTEVITGYMVGAGRDDQVSEVRARSLDAGSTAGRSGVAHLIASITGETYADLMTAQGTASEGPQTVDRAIDLAGKAPSGLKQVIQATVARFRAQKMDLPANFSLALTFGIGEKGEPANLTIVQSSGSKEIDEAALEILRKAGDFGVLGLLNASSSIRTALELTPASVHFSIAWPSADEQQSAERATKLSFLLKLVAAQQKKKSPAIGELLALIRCRPEGKLVVIEMTAPRDRWSDWTRTWLGAAPAPDGK